MLTFSITSAIMSLKYLISWKSHRQLLSQHSPLTDTIKSLTLEVIRNDFQWVCEFWHHPSMYLCQELHSSGQRRHWESPAEQLWNRIQYVQRNLFIFCKALLTGAESKKTGAGLKSMTKPVLKEEDYSLQKISEDSDFTSSSVWL